MKNTYAEGSAPDMRTIKSRIINGDLDGVIEGKTAYIYESYAEPNHLLQRIVNVTATT